jgi:hypothetical protein
LKAVREKKTIKITADFSMESLKARRAWREEFWELKKLNPTVLYPAKLSFQ